MHDVDYLRSVWRRGPRPLAGPLIYRTHTGALLRPMLRALGAVADLYGGWREEPASPLRVGFEDPLLVEGLALCAWPASSSGAKQRDQLGASVDHLGRSLGKPSVHIIAAGAPAWRHERWAGIERHCLVVEEVPVTPETLRPILGYLAAASDLGCDEGLLEQTGFVESFVDLVADGVELPAVLQAFDERVITGLDPSTQIFDPTVVETHETVARRQSGAPQVCLGHLVRNADDHALVALLTAYDVRRTVSGWTPYRIVSDLYRITGRLLEEQGPDAARRLATSGRRAPVQGEAAILWAALVLAWESRLLVGLAEESGYHRGPSTLTIALEGLGRSFLAERAETDRADPMNGRWGALGEALERRAASSTDRSGADPLISSRTRLVERLRAAAARAYPAAWIRTLHAALIGATAFADARENVDAERAHLPPTPAREIPKPILQPKTFAQVIGRERAVDHLQRLVHRDSWRNVLLHGPNDVGKHALARLYAQGLLCETESRQRAPCDHCSSCRSLDATGEAPGLLEIDTTDARCEARTEGIVARLSGGTLYRGWVVIVRNTEQYEARLFDRFLHPMEVQDNAAFVLLAENPDRVRPAGRSRCDEVRVRPLTPAQATALLQDLCAARGQICEPAALAFMADLSQGLPGRLLALDRALADQPHLTADGVRALLTPNGSGALAASWQPLLAHDACALGGLMRAGRVDRATGVALVHEALRGVYLYGLHGLPSPVWISRADSDALQAITATLRDRAHGAGRSVDAVWAASVGDWLAETHTHRWPSEREQDASPS